MRLATEPTSVKLPAKVAAMAITSHARCGSSKPGTNGLSNRTAGTLLTIFDSTAVMPASTALLSRRRRPAAAVISGVSTVFSSPATTTNDHHHHHDHRIRHQRAVMVRGHRRLLQLLGCEELASMRERDQKHGHDESDRRDWRQAPRENSVGNLRQASDDDVLRVAGDGRGTADVRRCRHRQQLWNGITFTKQIVSFTKKADSVPDAS